MSDLLNQASLVMVPSGYKEDTVYSVVPSDGSGDLSFTRASNGTRVNSAGLVEVCPWNELQDSETFTGTWTTSNVTITANDTTAPNGTTTAEKALCASGSSISPNIFYSGGLPCTSGQVYTYSYYAKKGTTNFAKIRFSGTAFASVTNTPIFNLNTGVLVSGTGTIESVGNGWYRISATATAEASASGVVTVDIPSSTGVWPNGNFAGTEYIYIWGAQLNIGSTAKPYFPTTDRLNVPRLTYQNGGGGCPSLLLEKQSTNVVTYSEQFDNAAYDKVNATITTNQTTSPDGTTNADKLTDDSTNDYHIVYPSTLSITASRVTTSVYLKNNNIQFGAVQLATSIGSTYDARITIVVDLINGTITDTEQIGTPNATYSIENIGNGWYRLIVSADHVSGNVSNLVCGSNSGTPSSFTAALPVYVGTGKSLFLWGMQIEASSYPTSYIPTTSSSATRVKDLAYKSGATALIGQTEGVLFCDFNLPSVETSGDYPFIVNMWKDSNNRFGFARYPNGGVHIYMQYGGSAQFTYNTAQLTGRFKLALGYKANDCVIYLNGTLLQTITSATIPATDDIIFNGINTSGDYNTQLQINQTALFKTRLTNAELASLTTI